MKCYCSKNELTLILYVDEVEPKYERNLLAAWYEKNRTGYQKTYSLVDKENGIGDKDIEIVCSNFSKLGPLMFKGNLDWEEVLPIIIDKFLKNNIEWYLFGSVSDAIRGIKITPHDMDLIVHTKDFLKVKDLFSDYVVEPFIDNKESWVVRYFGRVSLGRSYIDIVAAENLNSENHLYDKVVWKGYEVLVERFENRYQLELKRNRPDRLEAMDEYKKRLNIQI